MQPEAAAVAMCATHAAVAATGTCERCGRFACASCSRTDTDGFFCAECLARPETRLVPSPRAKRALWLAVLGFHGLVVLLPLAVWSARVELIAIGRGEAPAAGRPWAQGALALAAVGAAVWLVVGLVLADRL